LDRTLDKSYWRIKTTAQQDIYRMLRCVLLYAEDLNSQNYYTDTSLNHCLAHIPECDL